jgi:CheY-like chemotaxis protein
MTPPPTILVVDDEFASLEVLALLLEAEGYRVLTASDGAEALARLGVEGVELVVTDYMMPTMTGDELCRRMNAEARLRAVPVIMTTSMYRDDVPAAPQVVALFIKPLRFDDLLVAVRNLLGPGSTRRA